MLTVNIFHDNYMFIKAQYGSHIRYGLLCCAFLRLEGIGFILPRTSGLKERAPPERALLHTKYLLEKLT